MENVYQAGAALLRQGRSFAYVTIISQDGSTPRGVGSKMLVLEDAIEATIGGGLMEGRVIDLARSTVLPTHATQTMTFDLSGASAAEADFICGGRCEILLCYMDAANPDHLAVFSDVEQLMETGGTGWLVTALDESTGAVSLQLSRTPAHAALHGEDDLAMRYLIEPVHSGGVVYLFGAGHVSAQVARITTLLEFSTVVVDDRKEFLTPERFPGCRLLLLDSLKVLPSLPIDQNSYILIITRGHAHDEAVLRWAVPQPAGYIGMIGSRQKRDRIYQNMLADGCDQQRLEDVYSPVGLAIGGQTPAEIAVSIAAQLVQVRAARQSETGCL